MKDHDSTTPPETKLRRSLPNRRRGWITVAALVCAVTGLSFAAVGALATATSPTATTTFSAATAGQGSAGAGGRGANARSGPAAGGSAGTVSSASTSTFTLSTSTGQEVTVNTTASTTYEKGPRAATTRAVTRGVYVLVVGSTSGTTIKATQVIVQPTGDGSAAASSGHVVPFERGAPTTSKRVGQIPASYSEGSGTIVGGTAASKATEAALAVYPGGIADRVVRLSNGEYEVHNIGVNWPHHIFVDHDFHVVGAD